MGTQVGRRRTSIACAAILAACGSEPAPVAFSAFGAEARDAVCDWSVSCRHVPDRATCERLLDPRNYDTRRVADSIAAGRLVYDDSAAGECLESTRGAHCLTLPFSAPACDRMFQGTVGEGEPCTAGAECADGAACEQPVCDGACCAGICGEPMPAPPDPELAAVGERCQDHFDCVVEAYCETDGRCTATPEQPGERCLFGCARGDLFCDIESLTCREYAGPDEPCDGDGETAPPCDPAWAVCDAGRCAPRPGAGDPCGAPDRLCVAGLRCDDASGTCAARGTAGDACVDDADCDVACVDDVCAAYETCELTAGAETPARAPRWR